MAHIDQTITIIGAGVIGLSTAYALVKKGVSVQLIDASDTVGSGASYANGAQLSYRYVSPLADQGVPLQGLKWVGRADSPLNMRIRCSPSQWRWLLQFTLACSQKTNRLNGNHILRLSLLSQATLHNWMQKDQLSGYHWHRSGKMIIHRQQRDFEYAAHKVDPSVQKVLSPSESIDIEPSLIHIQSQLVGAIYAPNDETADAHQYCLALLDKLQKSSRFTFIKGTHVKTILTDKQKITQIITSQGDFKVDQLIIAAGNGATTLLNPLGIHLPIYPLKGYSLTLPFPQEPAVVPSISVTDYGHKTVYAKLGDRLRIAAMVDIGYENEGIRPERIQALKKIIQSTFPKLRHLDQAEAWSGLRPSTPKGPPILGKTPFKNLWLNVGHGSLGFTLAAGSAEVLAHLILQNESPIDLTGLTYQ